MNFWQCDRRTGVVDGYTFVFWFKEVGFFLSPLFTHFVLCQIKSSKWDVCKILLTGVKWIEKSGQGFWRYDGARDGKTDSWMFCLGDTT